MNDLKKQFPIGHTAGDKNKDAPCTLEEIERAQKDLLERSLQMVKIKTEIQKSNIYQLQN